MSMTSITTDLFMYELFGSLSHNWLTLSSEPVTLECTGGTGGAGRLSGAATVMNVGIVEAGPRWTVLEIRGALL